LESDRGSNVALDRQENSSTSELADMAVAHVDGKYRNTSGVLGFQQLYRKESIAYVDAKGIPPAEKVYRRSETNIAATPPIAKGEKQSEDRPQPNSNPPDLEPPLHQPTQSTQKATRYIPNATDQSLNEPRWVESTVEQYTLGTRCASTRRSRAAHSNRTID
jgi:hypothetical protein